MVNYPFTMSITSTLLNETYPAPNVPADPWKFGTDIQASQGYKFLQDARHKILFNKGRYFETTIYNPKILKQICELTGFTPKHTNMIVESWDKMEDFVIAMNILGIYVEIDIDWI